MNKTLLSAALIATLGFVALAPQTAHAVDGTINVTGQISAGTCKVGTGSPQNVPVVLPTVQTSALSFANAVAGRTPFSLVITGCATGIVGATTYFEPGPTIDVATGNLINSGVATNVEVQLLNGSGSSATAFSAIQLGAAQASQNSGQLTVASGGGTLNYYAQYFAKTSGVTAGTVISSVQFTMIYN